MAYTIERLSPQLVFIQWHDIPHRRATQSWLEDIDKILDRAEQPQYFLSDLQNGHVRDARALEKHSELTRHPLYGGGVTYGGSIATVRAVATAAQLSRASQIVHVSTIPDALERLEDLQPGLSRNLDLGALLYS